VTGTKLFSGIVSHLVSLQDEGLHSPVVFSMHLLYNTKAPQVMWGLLSMASQEGFEPPTTGLEVRDPIF
jgi:hypothetical protein